MTPPPTIAAYVAAQEQHDADTLGELFSQDAVLHSPLTDAFTFQGRWAVATVFRSAFDLFSATIVTNVIGSGDDWVIVLTGETPRANFEEAQILRLGADGLVESVTLIGRPVPALMDVMGRIGGSMQRRGLMTPTAGAASLGLRPVAALLGLIERVVMPRLTPRTRPR